MRSSSAAYWRKIRFPRAHYLPHSGDLADATFEFLCDAGMFIGDPEYVTCRLTELFDRAGGFGTLLIVMGKDWGTPDQRVRSLGLFADYVAPRLRTVAAQARVVGQNFASADGHGLRTGQ